MAAGCPSCGSEVWPGFRFCGSCGSEVGPACGRCATANPPGFRFCGACGAPLAVGPAAAAVLDRPREERKVATIVFADVVGFTGLAEVADPEEVARSVDLAFRRLTEIVETHGGAVHQLLGDGMMALFGVPQAHDDDAERAVVAALRMARVTDGGLAFSLGVNTGEVMVTTVGVGAVPTVIGDAVNVAARLEKLAGPGEVLVGPTTAALARGRIALTRRRPALVKGRSTPVEVWEATGLRPAGAAPIAPPPALVGRGDELAFLSATWRRVVSSRRPALALLTGEAGVGKTRLADELAAVAAADGARVVRASYPAYGGLGGPRVGASVVRQLGLTGDPEVDNRIRTVAGEEVAALKALDPAALLAEQAWAFRRLVEAKSGEQPLLVVVDDTHRSNGRLLELVAGVTSRVRNAAVLSLLVGRPEGMWLSAFESPTVVHLPPLEPADARALVACIAPDLPPPVVEEIVQRAGGNPLFLRELAAAAGSDGALPPSLQAILAARVDALPPLAKLALQHVAVFGGGVTADQVEALGPEGVAEQLDGLVQRGLVRSDGSGHLSVADSLLAEVAYEMLPRHTRAERHVAAAEVVRTSAERARHLDKAAMQDHDDELLAAGAGQALVSAGLEALDTGRLPDGVRLLERAVERGVRDPAVLLRLAQEHANALREDAIGPVLDLLPAELDTESALQARHLRALSRMGEDPRGADRALRRLAGEWAAAGYTAKAAWAHSNRGMALLAVGDAEGAAGAFDEAAGGFAAVGDEFGLSTVYRMLHVVRPDDARVPEWLTRALERAEEAGDRTAVVTASSGLMWYRYLRSRYGPEELAGPAEDEALRTARAAAEAGAEAEEAPAWCVAAMVAREGGRLDEARARAERAQPLAVALPGARSLLEATAFAVSLARGEDAPVPPPIVAVDPLGSMAAVLVVEALLLAGRGPEAYELRERSVPGPRLGTLSEVVTGLSVGWSHLATGRLSSALPPLERATTLVSRLGWAPGHAVAAALLAEARLRAGDAEGARAALAGVAPLSGTTGGGIAGTALLRARVLLGETELAGELSEACRRLAVPGLLPG